MAKGSLSTLNKELSNFSAIGAQRVDNLDAAQNTCQILIVELTLELHEEELGYARPFQMEADLVERIIR